MRTSWKAKAGTAITAAAMVAVLGFGAVQAIGAQESLRSTDCTLTNWCSGGQENCDACCYSQSGLCYSFDPSYQGCLCW